MAECKICDIINKKIEAKIVYEDGAVMAILSDEPTIFGHLLVFPKQHHATLEEVDEKVVTQLFYVASFAATAIFEGLGAEGTNIITCNGNNSNQRYPHLVIDILPRKTNDGLNFRWEPKKITPEDMDSIKEKIKDKAALIKLGAQDKAEASKTPAGPGEAKQDNKELVYDEDNYFVRHLRRIP